MSGATRDSGERDARILVVDDEEPIKKLVARVLNRNGYDPDMAGDATEAMAKLEAQAFDLVLTDVNMPGESGMQLLTHIVETYPDTAVVMVTGQDDAELAEMALRVGAYGYVIKPFEQNEILINVSNALRRRFLEMENRQHRTRLEQMVKARTHELWTAVQELELAQNELRSSREETIQRLSLAAEFRDDGTASHLHRMSRYCALLAHHAGMDGNQCDMIRLASVMHDVGKIGIPDNILLKPTGLDADEWQIMRTHCQIGYRILTGSNSELLRTAASVALTHHERMDGGGYPQGLIEDDIPLEGRIAAIADVFDALTTDRPYRKAFPLNEALDILKEGRGDHFDSKLLDLFLDAMDGVLRIKEEYSDVAPGGHVTAGARQV